LGYIYQILSLIHRGVSRQSLGTYFEDLLGWEQRIPRNSVWHALRTWREAHLKDEDFAGLYKATGRPAVSPARLTCALLIQMEQNWSDRQLEEATAFDDRVKYALGMGRSDPPLDATTLCRHRRRLLENDYGQELFERVVQQAKAEGFLSSEATVRLDWILFSSPGPRRARTPTPCCAGVSCAF